MKQIFILMITLPMLYCYSFAQSSNKTVVELMEKSATTEMLAQLDATFNSQIDQKKTVFEKPEDFEKFASIMKSGFNVKNVQMYVIEYFELFTNEDSLKSIIKIYKNSLVTEVNKLELAANSFTMENERIRFNEGLKENPPSSERIQQLITLNEELGTSEISVRILQNLIISIAKGYNGILPKERQIPEKDIEEIIKSNLPESYAQSVTNQVIEFCLFAYKDLSDEKLNDYIRVWQTPTGKYFSDNLFKAFDYSFSKMGKIVGSSMKTFIKEY